MVEKHLQRKILKAGEDDPFGVQVRKLYFQEQEIDKREHSDKVKEKFIEAGQDTRNANQFVKFVNAHLQDKVSKLEKIKAGYKQGVALPKEKESGQYRARYETIKNIEEIEVQDVNNNNQLTPVFVIVKYSSYTPAQKKATQKYRLNNKEKINEQRKKYYQNRKEKDPHFLEYKRQKAREYYLKKKENKAKLNELIVKPIEEVKEEFKKDYAWMKLQYPDIRVGQCFCNEIPGASRMLGSITEMRLYYEENDATAWQLIETIVDDQ